jgi:hypothetical protein
LGRNYILKPHGGVFWLFAGYVHFTFKINYLHMMTRLARFMLLPFYDLIHYKKEGVLVLRQDIKFGKLLTINGGI